MQDVVVHKVGDAVSSTPPKPRSPLSPGSSDTRRDIHLPNAVFAAPKPAAKEPNLAHQAALRRAHIRTIAQHSTSEHYPTTPSQPVLVRAAPQTASMKKKQRSVIDTGSPKLPSPESFSFQDILASVGPDADVAIDAIAEICGRSRMSLADEHSSHMPPHGEIESLPIARSETLGETGLGRRQTRSVSKRLALASPLSRRGDATPGNATTVTSNITSHVHTNDHVGGTAGSSMQPSMLPQILAWLRGHGNSDRDIGAVNALQRLLYDADSMRD